MPRLEPKTVLDSRTPRLVCADAVSGMKELYSYSPDWPALTIGSPPYPLKGERYGTGEGWEICNWIEMMEQATLAALAITNNAVVWIVNGSVREGRYQPACEGLVWTLYQAGIVCERPCIWHKNSPPNRKDWFGNDWEFCLCFRPDNSTRYFDWESIAGERKYETGGRFRQRDKNGERRLGNGYPQNTATRPRDVLRVTVGGGHMAETKAEDRLACQNEAPFPEKLVEPFIRALTKPGEIVLDPFVGSGTTLAVAEKLDRKWIGIDCRESQIELCKERLALVRSLY